MGSFFQQNSAGTDGVCVKISAGNPGVSGNSWILTRATSASTLMTITADLRLIDDDAHIWGYQCISVQDNGYGVHLGGGAKTLSARLDRLGVYTYSGYTLNSGTIVIQYA